MLVVLLAIAASAPVVAHSPSPVVRVDHHASQGEIVVTVGPLDIPASVHYHHHPSEERVRVQWPADDPTDAAYQYDVSTVLGAPTAAPHRHGHGPASLPR